MGLSRCPRAGDLVVRWMLRRKFNAFAEWFVIDTKIDTNKIRHVYSTMFYPPNDLPVPNWPPYDGNFPLPAALASPSAVQAARGPAQ